MPGILFSNKKLAPNGCFYIATKRKNYKLAWFFLEDIPMNDLRIISIMNTIGRKIT
jgi:hypothetical protein